jgi:20S proteasome subunit beta 1
MTLFTAAVLVQQRILKPLPTLSTSIVNSTGKFPFFSSAQFQIISPNCNSFSVQHAEAPTVRVVSSLFRELCYNNKDALQAGIIVAGWDKYHGGEVYSVPLGGSLHQQPFAIGGSGSTFIYGFCDAEYKEKMTRDECISFVSRGKP